MAHIPVKDMLSECDQLFNSGDQEAVGMHLRKWLNAARMCEDRGSELTLLNELMGHYRMNHDPVRGIATVKEGICLLRQLGLGGTLQGGTILINGATALHSFGKNDAALEYFSEAFRCYQAHLDSHDKRFAGLFNNMAAVYVDNGDYELAEKYYLQALDILAAAKALMDSAVTYVNLAQMYCRRDPVDPGIAVMLDAAMMCFDHPDAVRDGYYAHTCGKCAPAFGVMDRAEIEKELLKRAESIYARN